MTRHVTKMEFLGKDNHGIVEDHHDEVARLCYKDIFKRSWTYLVGGYLTYSSTLCIFPALTSSGKFLTESN